MPDGRAFGFDHVGSGELVEAYEQQNNGTKSSLFTVVLAALCGLDWRGEMKDIGSILGRLL